MAHGLPLTFSERRGFALSASIERLLVDATERATDYLKLTHPAYSAANVSRVSNCLPLLFWVISIAAVFTTVGTILLSMLVVLPTAFRLFVAALPAAKREDRRATIFFEPPDDELPIYTIIAPLRDEARVVDQLLSAIERLDYPPEKLDVIIAVEADCALTREAITARRHRIPLTVIPVPPSDVRTKPKALSVALPFARGTFTVIYDAEDRPEANQLRCALQAFRSEGEVLACVQARLCIDTKSHWLARYFTAEYAGHFDAYLPKLAALGLPLPLGGSSNHFRTATLRKVGGWDPYNVTEDADLGMRLARFGYRCGVINSTTYEEAPEDTRRWLGQRSRWLKGWMTTYFVHMRHPAVLFRDLRFFNFLAFQFVVGGNALVALAHPALLLRFFWDTLVSFLLSSATEVPLLLACSFAAASFGYMVSAAFAIAGLWRRRLWSAALVLFLTPVHWLLLSLAAACAARELLTRPYFWNKTRHGVEWSRSLLKLSHIIKDLERRGELPEIWSDSRNNAADRLQLPRAVA